MDAGCPAWASQRLDRADAADQEQSRQAWSRRERQASGSRSLDWMDAVDRAASQQACRECQTASGWQMLGRMEAAGWAQLQQVWPHREHPASEFEPLDRMDAVDSAELQQAWSRRERQESGWRRLDRMEAVDGAGSH
jgi:hypothetical protein